MVVRRPFLLVAVGIVLVVVDFRPGAPDLLPDVLGWLLVAWGAWRVRVRSSAVLALGAAACAVADVVPPYRWQYVDRATGEDLPPGVGIGTTYPQELRFEDLTGWWLVVAVAGFVLAVLTLGTLLVASARRARTSNPADLPWLRLAGVGVAVWLGPPLAAAVRALVRGDGYDPVWNPGAGEYVALAGVLAALAVAAICWRFAEQRWSLPPRERVASASRA